MFNPITANVPVTHGTVKRTLARLREVARANGQDRADLTMYHLRDTGKVEIAAGHFFTFSARTSRCRYLIEGTTEIDPSLVPVEVKGPVLDATQDMSRVTPPSPEEIEESAVARIRKRFLAVA